MSEDTPESRLLDEIIQATKKGNIVWQFALEPQGNEFKAEWLVRTLYYEWLRDDDPLLQVFVPHGEPLIVIYRNRSVGDRMHRLCDEIRKQIEKNQEKIHRSRLRVYPHLNQARPGEAEEIQKFLEVIKKFKSRKKSKQNPS